MANHYEKRYNNQMSQVAVNSIVSLNNATLYVNQCVLLVFKATVESSILAPLKHQCLISAKWQREDNWHVCMHIN